MIKQAAYLLIPVLMIACNNEEKKAEPAESKSADEHSGHATVVSNDYSDSVNNGVITEDTFKGSPHRIAMATVNGNHVHIEYNAPGVKGREIWGGLVPFDKVWATGAHTASSVQFSKDVTINNKKIPAGHYAFFTIPGKEKWTVILNTRYDQHMTDDYNEKEDVVRLDVKPEEHSLTQRLTFNVNTTDNNSGEITMQWEKILIRVPFNTNN
jgi:hypothetical protein